MKAKEFVKKWLKRHQSPIVAEETTQAEQDHFESLLTDLVKARDKQTNKAVKSALCGWCNQRAECKFNNGTEGSEPCVQYLAVQKAIKN